MKEERYFMWLIAVNLIGIGLMGAMIRFDNRRN